MTYLTQTDPDGAARLEVDSPGDGTIVFRLWPADNGDPIEFVARTQMDLQIVQTAVDCSNYARPGLKK